MAKTLPSKAQFLAVQNQVVGKKFSFVPKDSPGGPGGQAVMTSDDGSLFIRDLRLVTDSDILQLIAELTAWISKSQEDVAVALSDNAIPVKAEVVLGGGGGAVIVP